MRQFGFHEREDDEDDGTTSDEINIKRIALLPKPPRQPRQLRRPRREADKNRAEIKRQRKQRDDNRFSAVPLHGAKRAAHHMPPEADGEKFAVRAQERGHAPKTDQSEHEKNSPNEKKPARKMRDRSKKLHGGDRA